MGAETAAKNKKGKEGQSLLEFCLLLPVLLGLVTLMLRVNTAVQASIVNQQYVRAQALYLTFNSPIYPQNRLRQGSLTEKGYNQMMIGMSDEKFETGDTPKPTIQQVARRGLAGASESNQEEPELRARVRVRTTVSLCTQQTVLEDGTPILSLSGDDQNIPMGLYALNENSRFHPCRSSL